MVTLQELKNSKKGKLLGVDYGDVRTGLAVSDPDRLMAFGREYVKADGMESAVTAVAAYAKSENVTGIVVGLPKNMDGSEGHRADRCRRFAELLEEKTGIPTAVSDERMTTMAASRYLNETDTRGKKRKAVIDTLSAQIILQNAMDRMKNI